MAVAQKEIKSRIY